MGIFDKIKKLFKKEDQDKLEQEKLEKKSLIKQLETEPEPEQELKENIEHDKTNATLDTE